MFGRALAHDVDPRPAHVYFLSQYGVSAMQSVQWPFALPGLTSSFACTVLALSQLYFRRLRLSMDESTKVPSQRRNTWLASSCLKMGGQVTLSLQISGQGFSVALCVLMLLFGRVPALRALGFSSWHQFPTVVH